ncbi:MAG: 2,3-bisphosphoglycerate-independent phosphoglycerate mutase, partial [Myxococcales bacterium]|nr:2,3-bisphosphoglycerate-independent phosphoglycerate mutase [Myxococcales bacterium]
MTTPLKPFSKFSGVRGPTLLVVMDGVGEGPDDDGNAVRLARTPHLDRLRAGFRGTLVRTLRAHGTAVGLPSDADMGNSEVGHNALGAGRVFDQGAKRVNEAFRSGEIFEGEVWKGLCDQVRQSGEPMHFIGLLSDGNVHSHIDHLLQLISRCDQEEIGKVRVHILLDGRDVSETSALIYVDKLEAHLDSLRRDGRDYRVASGGGRMKVTMDRYNADWAMVERGWQVHVLGQGRGFPSARDAIETYRSETPGVIDQNLPGFVVHEGGEAVGPIRDGAAVVFFNFRGDRAIEITRAFEEENCSEFDRGRRPDVAYAGMMQYDGDLMLPKRFLVLPPSIDGTLGEHLACSGVTQFACSETQKYGHVTYFWNGNRSGYFDSSLETYLEIPSDNAPFEERPWMKAAEITDATIQHLLEGRCRHARINFPNGDMVGHTGVRDATILAVEAVDLCIGRLMEVIERLEGALIVTADHGNAD